MHENRPPNSDFQRKDFPQNSVFHGNVFLSCTYTPMETTPWKPPHVHNSRGPSNPAASRADNDDDMMAEAPDNSDTNDLNNDKLNC